MNCHIFGDSIAFGEGAIGKNSWAELLIKHFQKTKFNLSIYNKGICGNNTENLLKQLRKEIFKSKINKNDLIIFAIGINDSCILKGKNKISIINFEKNIKTIYFDSKKITKNIIFVGLTNVDEKINPTGIIFKKYYYNKIIQKYNTLIKNFCEKNNILFIDMFDLLTVDCLSDGLHPNNKCYKKMFNKIKESLVSNFF
jgi:acyl-CoA thioesterase I